MFHTARGNSQLNCSRAKLDEYATAITDFISKCVEDCIPKKMIRVFPNQKWRMNLGVHSQVVSKPATFKSNTPENSNFI